MELEHVHKTDSRAGRCGMVRLDDMPGLDRPAVFNLSEL